MSLLTDSDYKTILKYYNIDFNKLKKREIKKKAENVLADKLCKCIKRVGYKSTDETRAIQICRNKVIAEKNLNIYKFTCKNKPKLYPKNKSKINLTKKNKRTLKKYLLNKKNKTYKNKNIIKSRTIAKTKSKK